jgi:hypothetical protein
LVQFVNVFVAPPAVSDQVCGAGGDEGGGDEGGGDDGGSGDDGAAREPDAIRTRRR